MFIFGDTGFLGKALVEKFRHNILFGASSKNYRMYSSISHTEYNYFNNKSNCEIAIFCAAMRYNPKSYNDAPFNVYSSNVNAFASFLSCIKNLNNVKHVILISSYAVYGVSNDYKNESSNLKLSDLTNGEFYYGAAKIHQEELLIEFCKRSNINFSIIRIPSLYGPGSTLKIEYAHVIPSLIMKAIDADRGNITALGTGLEQRNFLYIHDLVNFIDHILHEPVGILNFSNGIQIPINQITLGIENLTSNRIKFQFVGSASSDVVVRNIDHSKFNFKFKSWSFTDFNNGLSKTYDWYFENYNNKNF